MYLLFDVGGTKTRIALSSDGESFGEAVKFDTPADFDEGIAKFVTEAKQLSQGVELRAAGGGASGPMSPDKSMLVNAPNLPGWNYKPLQERLATELGVPVFLNNDAAIVGLGEAHAGAGRGYDIVAYMTVSTGVGGARIVSGKIDTNRYGFEPGHQIIDIDQSICADCPSSEAEGTVSGTATAKRFGMKAYEVTDPAVWEELSRWTAVVVNNTVVHWSPDVVVLGGSMIVGDPAIPIERIEAHLKDILTIYPETPAIRRAELADIGGLHGALAYVKQCHEL